MSFFNEIRSADNTVLKRDGGSPKTLRRLPYAYGQCHMDEVWVS